MAEAPNFRKYGVPLYGAAWLPYKPIGFEEEKEKEESKEGKQPAVAAGDYVVLSGGGGEGRSGIRNAVLLAQFDFASNSLSLDPVTELKTESDLPYRLAVPPQGDGVICAMSKDCRFFEVVEENAAEDQKLRLRSSERVLDQLQDVGQQLGMVFNKDGSAFATGGEDGKLRVFNWPSMEVIFEEAEAHSSVKDLDFSHDGKLLVSSGNSGPCRVWDVTSSKAVASLSKEKDERFGFCRFSQLHDGTPVLYVTAVTGKGGSVLAYKTSSWKRTGSKFEIRDSINAFNVSADGKLLAVGTAEGDIIILDSVSMRKRTFVKNAHLVFVTALSFSPNSRAVLSVSVDSSARVTLVEDKKASGGPNIVWIILIVLIAVAVYYAMNRGLLLQ